MSKIDRLKKDIIRSFSMKDLGLAKQILGMRIIHDRKAKKLWLSREKYVKKVFERFNMSKIKIMSYSLANHFKLSSR